MTSVDCIWCGLGVWLGIGDGVRQGDGTTPESLKCLLHNPFGIFERSLKVLDNKIS